MNHHEVNPTLSHRSSGDAARARVAGQRTGVRSWAVFWAALALAGLSLLGCSPPGGIADACMSDADCEEDLFCSPDSVCTKRCESHTDCGCPFGTTNGDIQDGRCGKVCGSGRCTVVCTSSSDCQGTTLCRSGDVNDFCN